MTNLNKPLRELVKNWIAGDKLADAIYAAKELNEKGMQVMINVLGEHFKKESQVNSVVNEYLHLVRQISGKKLNASITVKETEIGLDIGKNYFMKNLERIVRLAEKYGIFVWLDMERYHYHDATIDAFLMLRENYHNIGIALQANLKRSEMDLMQIISRGGRVRLVKGVYQEGVRISLPPRLVRNNYKKLMLLLFKHSSSFAIATHDEELIRQAIRLNKKYRRDVEFQVLLGMDMPRVLKGQRVAVYLPYGKNWLPYVERRFAEIEATILPHLKF